MNLKAAIKEVDKRGVLLVFPKGNAPDPASLWSAFYPRSPMRWEWDETGDNRVAKLWHLREELSRSRKVVYAKWYQGRATVFSRELFVALLKRYHGSTQNERSLSAQARELLSILQQDSPQSTKALKKASGLAGRQNEAAYARALKELWSRLLIVGFGEVDEGAFPSLAIGATRVIFEDLWKESGELHPDEADRILGKFLPPETRFGDYFRKLEKSLQTTGTKKKVPSSISMDDAL